MEGQNGSSRRMCGAAAAYYLAVESYPESRQGQREVEIATVQLMAEGPEALIPDEPITIPLVVHVVYHDDSENISDEQIESQITVLNQDFAATTRIPPACPTCGQGSSLIPISGSRTSGYVSWPADCSATPSFPAGHLNSTA